MHLVCSYYYCSDISLTPFDVSESICVRHFDFPFVCVSAYRYAYTSHKLILSFHYK